MGSTSISQTIFRPSHNTFPPTIPVQHYSSLNIASAIDNLLSHREDVEIADKPVVLGVSHHVSVKGHLSHLCISANDRASIIQFDGGSLPSTAKNQGLPRLLDTQNFILVGFNFARTALLINSRTRLQVQGIDFSAIYRDPKHDSAFSAAVLVQKHVSNAADGWKIMRLWNGERGQLDRDLCLKAWLSYCVVTHRRTLDLTNAVRINTGHLNDWELAVLSRMIKEVEILGNARESEAVGDFSSANIDESGHVELTNSRYKTRIRRSEQAKVILTDSAGNDHWGNATAMEVRVFGRQEPLNHEKARDILIIDFLTGAKNLKDAPFIRALWFPDSQSTISTGGGSGITSTQAETLLRGVQLNDSQRSSVHSMVSEDPLIVVHGPPGTGKTSTIAASAKVWQACCKPAWIVAHSNVAVKNIAVALQKKEVEFKLIVSKDFHFDWHEHLYEKISERMIRSDDFNEDPRHTAELLDDVHIVLCTLSMLSNPVLQSCGLVKLVPIERLVIDEASQINAFEYLHIFDKFHKHLEKACFFGDPKQLPPFGKNEAPTIQTIFDFKKRIKKHLLDTQYRMPNPIGEFISNAVYDGQLKSQHSITTPDCVKFIDAQGSEEKSGMSWKNSRETDLMIHLVKNYYPKNFCIITPYDAQRAVIHAALEQNNLPSDTVFNLDSFQGNEADYILVSVVRTVKPGFLTSIERLNVLLTRAKKGLIIVSNRSFLKEGGSKTLLGKLSRHWQEKYPTTSSWADWRLVSQKQASLPGAPCAAPGSSSSSRVTASLPAGISSEAFPILSHSKSPNNPIPDGRSRRTGHSRKNDVPTPVATVPLSRKKPKPETQTNTSSHVEEQNLLKEIQKLRL